MAANAPSSSDQVSDGGTSTGGSSTSSESFAKSIGSLFRGDGHRHRHGHGHGHGRGYDFHLGFSLIFNKCFPSDDAGLRLQLQCVAAFAEKCALSQVDLDLSDKEYLWMTASDEAKAKVSASAQPFLRVLIDMLARQREALLNHRVILRKAIESFAAADLCMSEHAMKALLWGVRPGSDCFQEMIAVYLDDNKLFEALWVTKAYFLDYFEKRVIGSESAYCPRILPFNALDKMLVACSALLQHSHAAPDSEVIAHFEASGYKISNLEKLHGDVLHCIEKYAKTLYLSGFYK